MGDLTITTEMVIVLCILALTMYLFISEIVRVDVAAVSIMVLLGMISYVWPKLTGGHLLEIKSLFSGFSSNAVVSIIAVMIIGAGLDKAGLMGRLAGQIVKIGGTTEKRIIPLISGTVAFISSFMQNVGAAALFLPVVSRIANRTGLPMSRLLMPMGFCAILGGTMTMIGSSPLILLNDLILNSNKMLPTDMQPMKTFELFDVTPIGIVLVITGITYFILAGHYVLPENPQSAGIRAGDTADYLRQTYGLEGDIVEVSVAKNSTICQLTVEQLENLADHKIAAVALKTGDNTRISPARDVPIVEGSTLAILGTKANLLAFAEKQHLNVQEQLPTLADALSHTQAGIGELVIPPSSHLIGKTLLDIRMRKTYGVNVLAVHRGNQSFRDHLRHWVLQSGDTLVVHTSWQDLKALESNKDFIVVTTDYPHEELRPHKAIFALFFLVLTLGLVLFTNMILPLALFVGAIGMILTGVLKMDEAYGAVNWKSVFLLASLLPLGLAVETTGTAAWIAQETLRLLSGVPTWVLQAALAVLATIFTLLMSNVAATVLLVPLAVNIAVGADADPRVFALTVALATSNSFFIPTHQVNALLMGPGGYRVKDFMRAGGGMTILFLTMLLIMLNVVF
ncbi:SLC13 family permease [Thioflexithrix psekupsensis]|nr:SLC13 family permease [Thioflexithrix psekupsensis]